MTPQRREQRQIFTKKHSERIRTTFETPDYDKIVSSSERST
jgi:hypothetical protein